MTITEWFSGGRSRRAEDDGASAAEPRAGAEDRTLLVRYTLFNSFIVFVFAYAAFFLGGFQFLWDYDATRFSFLIIGIYALLTVYIGLAREAINADAVYFIGNRLTSIGLVGTVIGIMILMHDVGSSNIEDVAQVFSVLVRGMSTLLITTLFGMAFSLLVDFQMWVVFGREAK